MRQQKRKRGSHRSRVTAGASALTLRPLTSVVPTNRAGVVFSRHLVARALSVLGPPLKGSSFMRVERPASSGPTVRGEWVRAPGARREDAALLYVHGSAYALCSSKTHRGITTRLSARTGLPVFSCDYRLAPHHAFPCAADDVRAAYDWLLGEGHDPSRIVVAGDSAGGHLAVDLALELIREGRTPPVALALLSPVLDLSLSLAATRERMQRDPMISAARAARLVDLYVAGNESPRLRFSFDGAADFPPTLVHAGAREMLVGDATELARLLEECGASCRLEIWPDQMHVFQALTRVVPEAEDALENIARFLSDELDVAARRSRLTLVKGA
ncbi:MAG TPA: alpha/beta hydrolase [Nocardioidaceae bacterium]|nr:alpha/beta hydrolase [Nocardioidaceae bacterium]